MSQKVVSVEARRIYIEPGYMWSRGAKNVKLEEQEFIPNRVFTCDIGVYSGKNPSCCHHTARMTLGSLEKISNQSAASMTTY